MDAFLLRFHYRRWVLGVVLALALAGRGTAQVPGIPGEGQPVPSVPGPVGPEAGPGTGVPATVQVPEGMDPYMMPGPTAANPYRPSSPVLVNDQIWFAWYGNASRRAVLAPNMFGDISGTRSIGFSPFTVTINTGGTGGTPGTPGTGQLNAFVTDVGGARAAYLANLSTTISPAPGAMPNYAGVGLAGISFTSTTPAFQGGVFTGSVPLLENPTVTQLIQAQLSPTATFNSASQAVQFTPLNNIYNINLVYDGVAGGTAGTSGTAGTPTNVPLFTLFLPNPSGGGIAGRTLVATDNSPIPRDRIIFQYDYLALSKVVPGSKDYNRFAVGFEKTFFEGVTSIEVLLPFASTANSTIGDTSQGTNTELGNLFINFKALLAGGELFSLTSGVGVSLPTANDTRVQMAGTDLIRINNDALLITPYVAMLFTPTDRIFCQGWLGFGFDANGNPLKLFNGTGGLTQVGKLNDPLTMQADLQIGFWLLHPARNWGFLRGLAPFAELHFNGTLTGEDSVSIGSITIADVQGGYEELNATAGVVAQMWDNVNLSAGLTVPLKNGNNRYADYQVGVRLNWFFGATGDARTRALPYY